MTLQALLYRSLSEAWAVHRFHITYIVRNHIWSFGMKLFNPVAIAAGARPKYEYEDVERIRRRPGRY